MLTSPGRPYNDIPCMHRLSASTLAAVLLASVAPAAHAQAVTGLGEDAATVGAGRLRLSIGGDWSLAQQSYVPDGQGGHVLRPLGAALTVGVTPVEAKEIIYQAVPYVGMAKVFDFLHATNDVLTAHGVKLPLPGQSTTTPETRMKKGLAVQKHIVGDDQVDAMYADAPADEQHFQRFLSGNCFGDHYTRTGIDLPTRELLC